MEEIIFKPKYSPKIYLLLFVAILMGAFVLWEIISGRNRSPGHFYIAAVFGLMLAGLPFLFIRRITFMTDSFSIEKYLWPTKTIEYTDIVGIGLTMIRTRREIIGIQAMANSDELRNIFNRIMEQRKISQYQIENKTIHQIANSRIAYIAAIVIASIPWLIITFYVWPHGENSLLGYLILFIPEFFVVDWFLKNRADNQ
jgi:hypothetical protein